jgi:hypothetical protein
LRRLAGLRSGEYLAVADLMPQALRSIGFDPSAGTAVFMTRSQEILDVVQRDLDATGYGEYRMRPVNLSFEPRVAVYAALPDGGSWSGVGEGMTRRMNDADLLWHAAQSVSGTLAEVLGNRVAGLRDPPRRAHDPFIGQRYAACEHQWSGVVVPRRPRACGRAGGRPYPAGRPGAMRIADGDG